MYCTSDHTGCISGDTAYKFWPVQIPAYEPLGRALPRAVTTVKRQTVFGRIGRLAVDVPARAQVDEALLRQLDDCSFYYVLVTADTFGRITARKRKSPVVAAIVDKRGFDEDTRAIGESECHAGERSM